MLDTAPTEPLLMLPCADMLLPLATVQMLAVPAAAPCWLLDFFMRLRFDVRICSLEPISSDSESELDRSPFVAHIRLEVFGMFDVPVAVTETDDGEVDKDEVDEEVMCTET